ncbi:DUF996 domain-containing protein [Candidatus Bathyarchaeota archaeon]|nr:MAG: DUF996 domain-containing protein [Candidatus Bathyarchaeota archaeon]
MARVASLGQAKTLGGVGAILALLFWVPAHVGIVLLVAGLVLMLFAVKNIADIVGDQVIFSNMMYSVILAIIGPIIATVVLLAAAASFFGALSGFTPGSMTIPSGFFAALGFVVLAGVILWVCILISTVFVKRSYDTIATKLRVDMFRTTGLLFLIGAATLIVLVGFVILFIAAILQIVAFFSIPEQLPSQSPPQQVWGPPTPPAPMPPSLTPAQ